MIPGHYDTVSEPDRTEVIYLLVEGYQLGEYPELEEVDGNGQASVLWFSGYDQFGSPPPATMTVAENWGRFATATRSINNGAYLSSFNRATRYLVRGGGAESMDIYTGGSSPYASTTLTEYEIITNASFQPRVNRVEAANHAAGTVELSDPQWRTSYLDVTPRWYYTKARRVEIPVVPTPALSVVIDIKGQTTQVWVPLRYELVYMAGNGGSLAGTAYQTVQAGQSGTQVTAIPSAGHRFTGWSDGVLTPFRTDTGTQADLSVTANFVEDDGGEGGEENGEPNPPGIKRRAFGGFITGRLTTNKSYAFRGWHIGPWITWYYNGKTGIGAMFGSLPITEWLLRNIEEEDPNEP